MHIVAFEAPREHSNSTQKGQEGSPEPLCYDANIGPHMLLLKESFQRIVAK